MKKKLITLLIVAAIAVGGFFAIKAAFPANETETGSKKITITIIDQTGEKEVELLNKTYSTDAEYLQGLLEENKDELQADISTTESYSSVNGLMGLTTEDWNVGPWWIYESENSECCKLQGYCPSIDQCTISDGDSFTFYFMQY